MSTASFKFQTTVAGFIPRPYFANQNNFIPIPVPGGFHWELNAVEDYDSYLKNLTSFCKSNIFIIKISESFNTPHGKITIN